jgi:hypothetical protein
VALPENDPIEILHGWQTSGVADSLPECSGPLGTARKPLATGSGHISAVMRLGAGPNFFSRMRVSQDMGMLTMPKLLVLVGVWLILELIEGIEWFVDWDVRDRPQQNKLHR